MRKSGSTVMNWIATALTADIIFDPPARNEEKWVRLGKEIVFVCQFE